MKKKFIIILDGSMGSGKSTIGENLHKSLKRTALLNMDRIKWFISDYKRCKKDNAITNAIMLKMCDEYLKQKINLIIPQGFWKTRHIDPFLRLAKKYAARLLVYHLDAPRDILLERINKRKYNKVKPPAKTRVLRNIRSWKMGSYSMGKKFETHKVTVKSIVGEVLKDISRS